MQARICIQIFRDRRRYTNIRVGKDIHINRYISVYISMYTYVGRELDSAHASVREREEWMEAGAYTCV